MTRRTWRQTMLGAAIITGTSAIWVVVFIAQPWRSCPYDDSPAACVSTPRDATLLSLGLGVFLIAIVCLIILALGGHRQLEQRPDTRQPH